MQELPSVKCIHAAADLSSPPPLLMFVDYYVYGNNGRENRGRVNVEFFIFIGLQQQRV